jgi:Domain of unknown function (DUF5615)
VRLLLDQHYSPKIAQELRRLGHDVTSVEEQPNLRGLPDRSILSLAIAEQRALVTEDVVHFGRIVKESALAGERHFGVVFTSPRSMPRRARTFGLYVERLDALLHEHGADDALADQVAWLSPKPA